MYITSASWINPVSINYFSGVHSATAGAKMLNATLASMSRSSVSVAAQPSADFNTRAISLAFGGRHDFSIAASARADQGIGTLLDVTA